MKYIIELDDNNTLINTMGASNGLIIDPIDLKEYKEDHSSSTTLQLVKQGVSVDEIIKLKNMELI